MTLDYNHNSMPKNKKNGEYHHTDHETLANLTIHSIFVKDISYEAPVTPQIFSLAWEPSVKFDIQVMRRVIDQTANIYEVVLHANVTSKINLKGDSKENLHNLNVILKELKTEELVAFLVDIKLAGIFTVNGLEAHQLDKVLSTTAPTILFPYLAENISSLVNRGGFPQFILPPVDFFNLYQQQATATQTTDK